MNTRYRLFVFLFVIIISLILVAVVTADDKGENSGQSVGFTPIIGSPLTINVAVDGSYQVIHDAVDPGTPGQVYHTGQDEADAGIFVWYDGYVIGPDFDNHDISASNSYDAWSNVAQSAVTGTGTDSDPFVISTDLEHSASGVTASIDTTYVDSEDFFRIDWTICVPTDGDISTFLAADFYLEGSDNGIGYYDPATGSVGGFNEDQDWFQIFTPITAADAYYEDFFGAVWDAIGFAGTAGSGFPNTIETALIDNGGGLQWDETVSGCSSFASWWSFGTTPIIPPTSVDLIGLEGESPSLLMPWLIAILAVSIVSGAILLRRRAQAS